MINSTHNVNIDGNTLNRDDVMKTLRLDSDDRFTHWVVRPLGVLIALGLGTAAVIASIFMMVLSLAMVPLLLLGGWALKRKIEKDTLTAEATAETTVDDTLDGATETQA